MVITAGAANRMFMADRVQVISNAGMHDSDKLPGQPSCLSHACVALLSGKTGEIGQVSSLLPVTACAEPAPQTCLRLVQDSGIFSRFPGLAFRSYPVHQLETCPAPTGPA